MSDPYPHHVTILWGEMPEDEQEPQTYRFATKAELDAFMLGVYEMDGWLGLEVQEDSRET